MNFSNFDLFSQQFYFNIKSSQIRQGTLSGSLFSVLIIGLTTYYFVYLLNQYINNLIAPTYKVQNYTNDGSIDLELQEDLIAFRFESDYNLSVDVLQQKTNQTYIVYIAYLLYLQNSNYIYIPLDIIKCSTPDLLGYYCLDYSKISNYTLVSNVKNNILSQIQLNIYGCHDLDYYKTTIPDNCASQENINKLINGIFASLKIRIKTSQYNTTSNQLETSYRSSLIYGLSNQQILTTVKILEQKTKVKQGILIQSSSSFSSPVQYNIENLSLDKESSFLLAGVYQFMQVNILLDEMFQSVEIQFPSLPQIFSYVYSFFSMMMIVGFIARKFSLSTIKKDFIMLFLQNYYQGIYLQISKDIKLVEQNDQLNLQPQQTIISHHQNSQVQYNEEECDENQIQDEIENQQELFKNCLPSIPFQQKLVLDQKCKTRKIEFLKAENQSISTLDQNNTSNQHNMLQQQQQIQQCDVIESNTFQRESFENSKNHSNQKIINQINNKPKKKSIQKTNLNLSDPQEQTLHILSPSKQIQVSKNSNQFLNNIQNDRKKTPLIQNSFNTSNTPTILNVRNINNEQNKDFRKALLQLQVSKNTNISTKIDKFLFGCRCWKPKKITQNFNSNQLQKIENQIDKELDIFRIYKDILFLKKAVYIMLSQEQLAALQLIGCSSNFLDLDLNQLSESIKKQDKNLNYYEQQLAISLSDELQCQISSKFLEKCQNNKFNLDKIDLRILQSIQNEFVL
ncbi:AMP-binding enzyme family protein (macronuclear) [Tetrahymena thermophila SB210]|uniref:AMP-binding enzyme family protein n=1 Tax=Tetrahymena thermophila (strain SB210) TaxID=312017 RepID=I7LW67_TETTS|nr:AMP-binding enzyme family protein [Tetrahymena thermophila SB210]EAS01059.2 AMP-binding enzyme family protein [Tetrahymena thermophila SB210]|eukprot:XP_001021304.2 AMP-binding enzyme family protein [Tetrahymena thermophila SB210]